MNQTVQPIEDRVTVAPLTDVREDQEGYTLVADLPGVAGGAVQLTVEDRTLVLEAENDVSPPEGYTLLRREIPALRYRAVFELPQRVDAGGIKSSLSNGVLTVALPKREEVKPRRVPVVAG